MSEIRLQLNSIQCGLLMALITKQLREHKGWTDYPNLKNLIKKDCKELGEVYKVLYSQSWPDSPRIAKYLARLEKKFTKSNTPY
jgi:hypothetical protein